MYVLLVVMSSYKQKNMMFFKIQETFNFYSIKCQICYLLKILKIIFTDYKMSKKIISCSFKDWNALILSQTENVTFILIAVWRFVKSWRLLWEVFKVLWDLVVVVQKERRSNRNLWVLLISKQYKKSFCHILQEGRHSVVLLLCIWLWSLTFCSFFLGVYIS